MPLPTPNEVTRDIPAVGQVKGDAGLGVCSKLHVAQCPQEDVEDDDQGHPNVQNKGEVLWVFHLVLKR